VKLSFRFKQRETNRERKSEREVQEAKIKNERKGQREENYSRI
jgi:hypothetical protein